jgi:ribosomal protein S15P/S13E
MEILVPISLGELYDKQSILFIKLGRIKDEEKLKNIQNEYDLLTKFCKEHPIDHHYWYDLVHINSHIWAVEDNIREKEKLKIYDDQFINLAKEIYYSNDKRSEIKREINLKYGSNIVEEKSYTDYK